MGAIEGPSPLFDVVGRRRFAVVDLGRPISRLIRGQSDDGPEPHDAVMPDPVAAIALCTAARAGDQPALILDRIEDEELGDVPAAGGTQAPNSGSLLPQRDWRTPPGIGSPVLAKRLGIPGLRIWKVAKFLLLWCYFERGDHLDVVRLPGERQDIATNLGAEFDAD